MNILICYLGSLAEIFMASTVNKGLTKQYEDCNIHWIVDPDVKYLFKYNKRVQRVFTPDEFSSFYQQESYDILVNFDRDSKIVDSVYAKDKRGFNFDLNCQKYYDCLYSDVPLKMNLFQIYFRITKMSWRGEGTDINYYPKYKSKKNRVGLAVANTNLRKFVHEQLQLEMSKLWVVPYKKNVFKRMDELNRCKVIITDDLLTLSLAVSLQKFVYFLRVVALPFEIELFRNGKILEIPNSYLT